METSKDFAGWHLKKVAILALTLLTSATASWSQTKYWIFLRDKEVSDQAWVSQQTIENRRMLALPVGQVSDFPVTERYVKALSDDLNVTAVNRSRWLNAVTAYLTYEQFHAVKSLPFVTGVLPLRSNALVPAGNVASLDDRQLANGLRSVHATSFVEAGLTGKGVSIGILDIGFVKADIDPALKNIFDNQRVLGVRNYITPSNDNIYENIESTDDRHGTLVWRMIAGSNPYTNKQEGLAVDAQFYLARTDNGRYEFRGEEDNWVVAIEWMDSVGVRLIHSSLGYSIDFTDVTENYTPHQMDGKTSVVSRIASMAVKEKGMIVVTSAGNNGNKPEWRLVSAPADVEGVITVGAVDEHKQKQEYSGEGPSFLSYTKPDVMCYSNNGTSLAAPIITGMIACMLQRKPDLTNSEIQNILCQSGHLYPMPNNFVGAGVPDGEKVLKALSGASHVPAKVVEIRQAGSSIRIPVKSGDEAVVFHKKSKDVVLQQKFVSASGTTLSINRPKSTARTTIVFGDRLIEVYWE